MTSGILLLSLSLGALPQEAPLGEALSVHRILDELNKHSGSKVRAAGALADKILIVKNLNALGDRVLPLLSEVLCAKLDQRGGEQILTPDGERQKQREAELSQLRKAALTKSLKDFAQNAGASDLSEAESLLRKIQALQISTSGIPQQSLALFSGLTSAGSLAKSLITLIGPNTLHEIKDGEYLTYSTRPIGEERGLPRGSDLLIERLQSVQRSLLGLLESRTPGPGQEQLWASMIRAAKAAEKSIDVLLVLNRSGEAFGVRCELFADDSRIDTGILSIPLIVQATALQTDPKNFAPSLRSSVGKKLFEAGNSGTPSEISEEQIKLSGAFATSEPFSFFLPELFSVLNEGPILAALPDSIFTVALRFSTGNAADLPAFLRATQERGIRFERSGDVLLVRPIAPSQLDGQEALRKAIATHLLGHSPKKDVPAYSYFQFARVAEKYVRAQSAVGRFYPNMLASAGWRILWPRRLFPLAFPVLASLSIQQIHGLERGNAIPFEALAPPQVSMIANWACADTYDSTRYSEAGIRRLQSSRLSLALGKSDEVWLLANPKPQFAGWFPRSPLPAEEWRNRLLDAAKGLNQTPEAVAMGAEWCATPVEKWPFRIDSGQGTKLSVHFEWAIPNRIQFEPWMNLPESLRKAVLP